MLQLIPSVREGQPIRVLCIGAHCDDIEIGCGGTLLALQEAGWVSQIDWVVLSGTDLRRAETERSMEMFIRPEMRGELLHGDFPDGSMPGHYGEVKAFFESLKSRRTPSLVFTHEREDRHQDHRLVNEMTWNTFRDQLVLEYEIPKWDGGLGQPNVYFPISSTHAQKKIDTLMDSYVSQSQRDWFSPETFRALLRLRGIESRAGSGLAEAFHGRKLLINGALPSRR
jgi:LmbE family N-acetylglucosaminyl deacetylase